MKITTLIENRASTSNPDLKSEWGLALHISFNNHFILFDTGASDSFADNAEQLSVDINACNAVVLSHHHYDHGGGLRRFFEINSKASAYLAEPPEGDCHIQILRFFNKYIGLDKQVMQTYAGRFITVETTIEILPDVFLLPHITSVRLILK